MNYDKPPLTFEEQADLLRSRGLAGDRDLMIQRLRSVSYYRLSGYTYTFRKPNPDVYGQLLSEFQAGSTFDDVWARYTFDRRLRLIVMDALERIEISVRSQIATLHGTTNGTFGYASAPASLPRLRARDYQEWLSNVEREHERSKDPFAKHFNDKYGDSHSHLPIWMACEVMSFGTLLTMYRGCDSPIQKSVARVFGVHETVFSSWLLTLNTTRNICAHHGRLWNRELGTKPKIPDRLVQWHQPIRVDGDRLFGVLTICKWCLDHVAPQSGWARRVTCLLDESPSIPRRSMGFPDNWQRCPIWQIE